MLKNFFKGLFSNISQIFIGKNLIWQIVAMTLTILIVLSGLDWQYFVFFEKSGLIPYLFPAAFIGAVIPVLVPILLILWRKWKIFFYLVQAEITAWLTCAFYKFFTGRVPPEINHLGSRILDLTPLTKFSPTILDNSRIFQFGFFRGGIFWGWPSTHTAIAFAMGITLWYMFPKNKVIKILALIYVIYILIGVSTTIHWLSDVVAGAIMGSIIGATVVKSFLKENYNPSA